MKRNVYYWMMAMPDRLTALSVFKNHHQQNIKLNDKYNCHFDEMFSWLKTSEGARFWLSVYINLHPNLKGD